jgi:hypothetical protein
MIDLVRSFAAALLFSCPLIAQSVTISDRKISGPFGPVHSIRTEAFNCSGDTTEQPWRTDEVTYDRQGNETWRAYSNRDGSVGHQVSNTFDADGRMTGWNEYYGKSDFPPAGLHRHAVFTYSNGKIFQILVYSENVLEYKGTY